MKYIIKNCPALLDGERYGKYNGECCDKEIGTRCEYCKDCLLKQIVDKCNDVKAILKRNTYVGEYIEFREINPLADEILQLLDIQEIEE